MAYSRDSWSAITHVAMAALAFHSVTTSARASGDHPRLRERTKAQIPNVNFLIEPPFGGVEPCPDMGGD
jgi:hypothetical protein